MMRSERTWEEAVRWLRGQPDQQTLVRACYLDDPLLEAARRFRASEEWRAVESVLPSPPGWALDLGAGRGIGSYALALAGWKVVALEPDRSALVGSGAILSLAREAALPILPLRGMAERIPLRDCSLGLVYARQALHHAADLDQACREAARVLKPGGRLVATREHVIDKSADLERFRERHPLHRFYGGEMAYRLDEYLTALRSAGLRVLQVLGPFESLMNLSPLPASGEPSTTGLRACAGRLVRRLAREHQGPMPGLRARMASLLSRLYRCPGRLYSFVAERPV